MYFTFPDFPVNAVSKMLEKTGPGQRSVTAIFLSNISTPRVENQPYKVAKDRDCYISVNLYPQVENPTK